MSDDTKTTITLHSYQKVWYYQRYVYRLGKMNLPTPVTEADMMCFLACLCITGAVKLALRLPISNPSMVLMYYLGLPLLVTAVLRYKTFDGKHPLRFLMDYVRFLLVDRNKQYEFFVLVVEEPAHTMVWQVGYRYRLQLRQSIGRGRHKQ